MDDNTGSWRSGIPLHLPDRLTITLWDFSWYTQTAAGEPFHDLDQAFEQVIDRGYNTVRICAAPILLFGDHGIDTSHLTMSNLGGEVGQMTRWYDAQGGVSMDLHARFFELLEKARQHGVFIIISSWEYQQSPCFLSTSEWADALNAIAIDERFDALARCYARMLTEIKSRDLFAAVAYVELHNEVDLSMLGSEGRWVQEDYWTQKAPMERAISSLREAHPDVMHTTCYGIPPFIHMDSAPENAQIAHHHIYIHGVLAALRDWVHIEAAPPVFPTLELKSILRSDAPPFEEYASEVEPWRLEATLLPKSMLYAFDFADGPAWDAWLYRNYALYESEMKRGIDYRLRAIAIWAKRHNVPAVIGEGWIGYIPVASDFEDGAIGQELSRYAMRRAKELDFWGVGA